MAVDWKGISGRIKGLISLGSDAELAHSAARLGVSEQELRDAIDDTSRRATLEVVSAIVCVYGLDPTWALTGTYNAETHRHALRGDRTDVDRLVRRILSDPFKPPSAERTSESR